MIKLTLQLSEQEYRNVLRLHAILEKTKTGGITPSDLDEHRRLHDRTASGVLIAAMIAAADHKEMCKERRALEVVNG